MSNVKVGLAVYQDRLSLSEIRERVDLRQVVRLTESTRHARSGDWYMSGLCPFHDDHRPSFLVYRDAYVCLACGAQGSVFDWLMNVEGLTDWGEIKDRALELAGGAVGSLPSARLSVPKVPDSELCPSPLPEAELEQYAMPNWAPEAVRFQQHYQIGPAEWDFFRLGYCRRMLGYVIPVLDWDGRSVLTLRFRRDDDARMETGRGIVGPKYWGVPGRNGVYLFNRHLLPQARWPDESRPSTLADLQPIGDDVPVAGRMYYAFGEMTAIFISARFGPCVSHTNGKGSFKEYLLPLVQGVAELIVVPDVGEEEQAHAVGVLAREKLGISASVLSLPVDLPDRWDVIDMFREGFGSPGLWQALLEERVSAGEVRRAFQGGMKGWWVR